MTWQWWRREIPQQQQPLTHILLKKKKTSAVQMKARSQNNGNLEPKKKKTHKWHDFESCPSCPEAFCHLWVSHLALARQLILQVGECGREGLYEWRGGKQPFYAQQMGDGGKYSSRTPGNKSLLISSKCFKQTDRASVTINISHGMAEAFYSSVSSLSRLTERPPSKRNAQHGTVPVLPCSCL